MPSSEKLDSQRGLGRLCDSQTGIESHDVPCLTILAAKFKNRSGCSISALQSNGLWVVAAFASAWHVKCVVSGIPKSTPPFWLAERMHGLTLNHGLPRPNKLHSSHEGYQSLVSQSLHSGAWKALCLYSWCSRLSQAVWLAASLHYQKSLHQPVWAKIMHSLFGGGV